MVGIPSFLPPASLELSLWAFKVFAFLRSPASRILPSSPFELIHPKVDRSWILRGFPREGYSNSFKLELLFGLGSVNSFPFRLATTSLAMASARCLISEAYPLEQTKGVFALLPGGGLRC